MEMEITTKIGCSNNCKYCCQDKLLNVYEGKTMLSFEDFVKCIDKIPEKVIISFSGFVEPFLNPECSKMIVYAFLKGHKIKLFTSLMGMSMQDLMLIKKIPFKNLTIHIPENHNLTNIKVTEEYKKKLKLIEEFNNVDYVVLDGDVSKELNLDSINVRKVKSITRGESPEKNKGKLFCSNELKHNVLLPNGDVVLCCMDYGLQHKLGNLLKDNYEDLFLGEEMIKVTGGLLNEDSEILCRYCVSAKKKTFFNKLINKVRRKRRGE